MSGAAADLLPLRRRVGDVPRVQAAVCPGLASILRAGGPPTGPSPGSLWQVGSLGSSSVHTAQLRVQASAHMAQSGVLEPLNLEELQRGRPARLGLTSRPCPWSAWGCGWGRGLTWSAAHRRTSWAGQHGTARLHQRPRSSGRAIHLLPCGGLMGPSRSFVRFLVASWGARPLSDYLVGLVCEWLVPHGFLLSKSWLHLDMELELALREGN